MILMIFSNLALSAECDLSLPSALSLPVVVVVVVVVVDHFLLRPAQQGCIIVTHLYLRSGGRRGVPPFRVCLEVTL